MSDRRLLILAGVSLVLALLVCLPIPLSYEGERLTFRRGRLGGFRVEWRTPLLSTGAPARGTDSRQFLYVVTYNRRVAQSGPGPAVLVHDLRCSNAVLVPPLFFFPSWAVLRLIGEIRQDSRRLRGLCPVCGYDLRASTGRCPECGADPSSRGRPPTG